MDPDQPPLAVHPVAFVACHVSAADSPLFSIVGIADRDTFGFGSSGVSLPEPLQALIVKAIIAITISRLVCIRTTSNFFQSNIVNKFSTPQKSEHQELIATVQYWYLPQYSDTYRCNIDCLGKIVTLKKQIGYVRLASK